MGKLIKKNINKKEIVLLLSILSCISSVSFLFVIYSVKQNGLNRPVFEFIGIVFTNIIVILSPVLVNKLLK